MPSIRTLAAAPALLAVLSLSAIPAQAADLPVPASPATIHGAAAWVPGADNAQAHRYRGRHYDNGIDAGDVLAGVLIIGGIAAIASAVEGDRDRDRQPAPPYPDQRRGDYRYDDGRGLDRAVSLCVDTIERDARVDTVDAVNRNARGWMVTGSLFDGQDFSCSIGADGRIEAIDYGRGGRSYGASANGGYDDETGPQGEDRQYDDDYYTAARARSDDAQPAYPGGPLPGEDEGAVDGDIEYGTGYRGVGG